MLAQLEDAMSQFLNSPDSIVMLGIAVGVLMLFVGAANILRDRNPAAARMAAIASRGDQRRDRGLLKPAEFDPKGMMRHFVPTKDKDRTALEAKFLRAGISNPNALQYFTLFRIFFGLLLPGILLVVLLLAKVPNSILPDELSGMVSSLSHLRIFQIVTVLVAVGYFLPNYWLSARVTERSRQIEESFPNALDLMQVSLEAGLGFDAAMTRVGNELTPVSPAMATEFLTVQRQIQAGRSRDEALRGMAERSGVDTVRSFASVVQQSTQFGTPMNEALMTYAKEMRSFREMKAQEMANKLPVKMSAVLASFMLPALIMLTLGPTVIRWVRNFG